MYQFTVTINKAQIAAEVRNDTHKFGKGRDNGQLTPHQVSNLQADDLNQDTAIVNTALNSAMERAVSSLSKHIDGISPGETTIAITFKMSKYYSPLSDSSVESGLKDFVRAQTIYEYLKIVAPSESVLYLKEADQKLSQVKSSLNYKKWHTA